MYRVTCDGFPLLDWRDKDLTLADPKVSLEVNTVGEGSFTIYKGHPHYDKLQKMKSVVEVSDETGIIFRGRATGDTVDFEHGMNVDLEGVMAFFNDSLVRPFNFPGDFQEDPDYLTADASGERVAFFLGWLIDNHNSQVQGFQKLKLGNVTVRDDKLVRSSDQYASTWAMIKAKLFDSTLGGYLCIRYEEDGNYIDYLSEFTETNSQEIRFGENLLNLSNATEASGIYTAIVPFGALGLTLTGLKDGDITDDIVKSGDTLYSRKAVDQFGWIYAPTESTTWDEVVDDAELLTAGVEWLAKGGAFLNAIDATAVDLHFTDAQIESLRIYKNVKVHSEPHGLAEIFPLSRLEIDLLNSQNTRIKVGKTSATWTEQAAQLQDEVKKNYSRLSKNDESIKMEVAKEITDTLKSYSTHEQTAESISTAVKSLKETVDGKFESYSTTEQTADSISTAVKSLKETVDGKFESYSTHEQTADSISTAVKSLKETVDGKFESYSTTEQTAESISAAVNGLIDGEAAQALIDASLEGITLSASSKDGETTFTLKGAGAELKTQTLKLTVDAAHITGKLLVGNLPEGIVTDDDLPTHLSDLETDDEFEQGITSIIGGVVTADYVNALGITAAKVSANNVTAGILNAGRIALDGLMEVINGTARGYIGANNVKGGAVIANNDASVYCIATSAAAKMSYQDEKMIWAAEGGCYSNETMQIYSDRTLKNTISYDLSAEEELFKLLRPCSFVYNSDKDSKKHWGFIAQDFMQSAAAVGMDTDKLAVLSQYDGKLSLGYGEVTVLNTHMLQILWERVDALEKAGG